MPYLGRAAIAATLRYIASVPKSEVVFDYSEPLENYPPEWRAEIVELGAFAAVIGEPWLSHFDPDEIAQELRGYGFGDLGRVGYVRDRRTLSGGTRRARLPSAEGAGPRS